MQSVSKMAALERTDMLRQLIEMPRCANFSKNTSLSSDAGRTIIWGGGANIHIIMCVPPNSLLLKSIVFTVCEHKYVNIFPPSIIVLPAPLSLRGNVVIQRGTLCEYTNLYCIAEQGRASV